jgi:hypothetical protein
VRATILPAATKVPLPRLLRLCSFWGVAIGRLEDSQSRLLFGGIVVGPGIALFSRSVFEQFPWSYCWWPGQGSPETSVGPEVPYGPRTVHAVDAQARPRAALDRWQFRADCVGDVSHLEAGL